jgi:protein-tyrosine phosphatase
MKNEKNDTACPRTLVPRTISLEGCLNFRDLGGYTGEGGAVIRYGRVYRADDLSRLSAADMIAIGKLGLSDVIDLRSAGELDMAPNPLRNFPGYHHIPLLDGVNSETGGPPRIRRQVCQSLPEMYRFLLTDSAPLFGRIFRVLAAAAGAAVFHCTAGKDRTGVTAALLLNLCGVADGDIIADYALTYELMRARFEVMAQKARESGVLIPDHMFHSEAAFMREFLDFLKRSYGGAEQYLLGAGLDLQELRGIKDRLLNREHV